MIDLSKIQFGPKMQACSERERQFVLQYLLVCADEGKANATEAARRAGYSDPANGDGYGSAAIRVQAHALLHRDRVREAIAEVGRKEFLGLLFPAVMAARKLIESPSHPDHAGMVKSTLSALGLGERTAVDVNVSGEITLSHTDQALEDLRRLKEIGVPREKLIELFGYSGLERYESMLAAAPKLLELKAQPADG